MMKLWENSKKINNNIRIYLKKHNIYLKSKSPVCLGIQDSSQQGLEIPEEVGLIQEAQGVWAI
jgi:hypothetical protein